MRKKMIKVKIFAENNDLSYSTVLRMIKRGELDHMNFTTQASETGPSSDLSQVTTDGHISRGVLLARGPHMFVVNTKADGTKELLQHLKTIASAPTPMSIGKELPENHVDRIISEYLYLKGEEYGAAKKTAADDSGKNIVSPRGSRGARQA